jgi:hypothetical protein
MNAPMLAAIANALLHEADTMNTTIDADLHLLAVGVQGDTESAHQADDLLWTTTMAETTEDAVLQETIMDPLRGDTTWIRMLPVDHRPPIVATQNPTLEMEIPTDAHAARLAMATAQGMEATTSDDIRNARSYVCRSIDVLRIASKAWWAFRTWDFSLWMRDLRTKTVVDCKLTLGPSHTKLPILFMPGLGKTLLLYKSLRRVSFPILGLSNGRV